MAVDGQRFMTKTQHYRKVTKPLLERKRRARMNLYLDELKELIVDSMEADGEHIAKLEKADILELTVNYLKAQRPTAREQQRRQQQQRGGRDPVAINGGGFNAEKYCAGYTQAAYEVSKVFATIPGVDLKFGTHLLKHLGCQLRELKSANAINSPTIAATAGTGIVATARVAAVDAPNAVAKAEDVWRPW